jgi:hypothetical protein
MRQSAVHLRRHVKDPSNGDLPPRAWPEAVRLYDALQRRIGECLAGIGADPNARDAARITRVPGSTHTGADRSVFYRIFTDPEGEILRYTLEDFAQRLGVSVEEPRLRVAGPAPPEVRRQKQAARRARWEYPRRDLVALENGRGGFKEGTRNSAVAIYACVLGQLEWPTDRIESEVLAFAARCRPRLPRKEALGAFRQGITWGRRGIRHQTIADRLEVTPDEVNRYGLRLPHAKRFGSAVPGRRFESKTDEIEQRRTFLRQVIADRGHIPPYRNLLEAVQYGGFEVRSPETVRADVKALRDAGQLDGYSRNRGRSR